MRGGGGTKSVHVWREEHGACLKTHRLLPVLMSMSACGSKAVKKHKAKKIFTNNICKGITNTGACWWLASLNTLKLYDAMPLTWL